jgi:hypothetical protein
MPPSDRLGYGRPGEQYGWGRDGRVRLEERPIPIRQRDPLDGLEGRLGRLRLGGGGSGGLLGGSDSSRRLLHNGSDAGSVRGSLLDVRRNPYLEHDLEVDRGPMRGSLRNLRRDVYEHDLDSNRGSARGSLVDFRRDQCEHDLEMDRGSRSGSLRDLRRDIYEHDLEMNRGYSSNEQLNGRLPGLPALPGGLRSRSGSSLGRGSVHSLPHHDRQPRNYHYQRPYVEDDIESLEERRREEDMRYGRNPGDHYEASLHEEEWIGPISMRGGL